MDWLSVAKELDVGRSRKIVHDCSKGGDRSLSVSNEPECYRAYCYRCKAKLWEPKRLSLGELIRINQDRRDADKVLRQQDAPAPAVFAWKLWPTEAQCWLLKAGIGEVDAHNLGIYYHPPSMRVVLPYPGTHHWQARAVMQGHKPKYISDGGTRQAALVKPNKEQGYSVVLTEDLLSTYKMQMAGRSAMPLLGTVLHDEHLAKLLAWGRTVTIWLDPDEAGQKTAAAISKRLDIFGVEHRNVVGDRDPKLYTRGEINQILEDTWH